MTKVLKIVKYGCAVVALLVLVFACYIGICYRQYRHMFDLRRAEQDRAAEAMSRMGGTGASYTLCRDKDGPFNEMEFNLRYKGVDDKLAANLEGLTGIVGLDLSETKITDTGLVHLKGLTCLVYLQLADTDITDEGLENLSGLTNLEAIDLSGTKVSQEGAKYLEKLPKLKRVYARGTGLTSVAGVEVDRSQPSQTWRKLENRPDFLRGPLSARRRAAAGKTLWDESDGYILQRPTPESR